MKVIRAPGRLVVNPTDLGVAYPFGGIEIGLTKSVVVQSLGSLFRVQNEGLGEATDVVEANNRWVVGLFVRGFDDDALTHLLADHADVGAVSGHTHLIVPNRAQPGTSALPRAKKFLYYPEDPINVPSLLVYRGIPDLADNAEIAFQRGQEFGFPMAIECLRGDSGRILEIGRLADLPRNP